MRILLFGRDGQLGKELQRSLSTISDLVAVDQTDVDLANLDLLAQFIQDSNPQIIVNAAAYTNVDQAESEIDMAYQINADAPECIAEHAKRSRAIFIHFSTDYVFDGNTVEPYTETDPTGPLNVYGASKLEGEKRVLQRCETSLILRTSWLYGDKRSSFPFKVIEWVHKQEVVKIVDDQVGSPTWSVSLADCTRTIIKKLELSDPKSVVDVSGIYHLAGRGYVSRFGWAKAILNLDPNKSSQSLKELIPAKSHEFQSPAKRPAFSALDCSKVDRIFGVKMLDWEVDLRNAMELGI